MSTSYSFFARHHGFVHVRLRDDNSVVCFVPGRDRRVWLADVTHLGPASGVPTDMPIEMKKAIGLLQFQRVYPRPDTCRQPGQRLGRYHPRIWRGYYDPSNPLCTYDPIDVRETYGSSFVQSVVAAEGLFQDLVALFQYIEPAKPNGNTFGHKFRTLLILACSEVEACWRGVLAANGVDVNRATSTKDYVRLRDPLSLSAYEVTLRDYPDYGPINPFAQWDATQPTQSLNWYHAYNAVKHDRELHFQDATLSHVVHACAGLYVQLCAQWGPSIFDKYHKAAESPFSVSRLPEWQAHELYVPEFDEKLEARWAPEPVFSSGDK